MPNLYVAHKGLSSAFLNDLKSRIQSCSLEKAEAYFAEEGIALTINGENTVTFDDGEKTIDSVQSVATENWQITADQSGRRIWYVSPFNPYSAGNKSAPASRRPVFAVDWTTRIEFAFVASDA